MKTRKIAISASISSEVHAALEAYTAKYNVNFSAALNANLERAFGIVSNVKDYEKLGNKPTREPSEYAKMVIKMAKLPWPKNMQDVRDNPNRTIAGFYSTIRHAPRWGIHEPGGYCPADCPDLEDPKNHPEITQSERNELEHYKQRYGISSL